MRKGTLNPRSYANGLDRMQTVIVGESLTRQDQADLVNINKIYAKTQRGEIVLASDVMPEFGDFSNIDSYDVMLEKINEAEEAFMLLPSSEREKYDHDPAKYYQGKFEEATQELSKQAAKDKEKEEKEKHAKKVQQAKDLLSKEPNSD